MSWQNLRGNLGIVGLAGVFAAQVALAEQGHSLPIKKIWVDESRQVVVEFKNSNGTFPTVPHVLDLPGPNHRVVLDFADSTLDKAALPSAEELTSTISQALPFVKSLRYSNLPNAAKPTARIVLDLPESMKVKPRVVKLEEGAITINLGDEVKVADAANDGIVHEVTFKQAPESSVSPQEQADAQSTSSENANKLADANQGQSSSGQAWDWSNGGQSSTNAPGQAQAEAVAPAMSQNDSKSELRTEIEGTASNSGQGSELKDGAQVDKTADLGSPEDLGPEGQTQSTLSQATGEGQQEQAAAQSTTSTDESAQGQVSTQSSTTGGSLEESASAQAGNSPPSATAQTASPLESTAAQETSPTANSQDSAMANGNEGESAATQPVASTDNQQEQATDRQANQQTLEATSANGTTAAGDGNANVPKEELRQLSTDSATTQSYSGGTPTQQNDGAGPSADAPTSGQEKSALPASEQSKINNIEAVKRYNSAVQHHLSGKLSEAVADYQAALDANPNLSEAHSNLGLIYNQQHNYAQALSEFRKALAINPRDAITYNGIGAALRAQRDLLGAVKNWQTAVSLDPQLATAHYNLGTAYEIQKDYDKAVDSYRQAVKNDYRLGEAYYRIGLIMERRHRNDEAAEEFGQALKVSSTSEYSEDARQRLAFLTQSKKSAKR